MEIRKENKCMKSHISTKTNLFHLLFRFRKEIINHKFKTIVSILFLIKPIKKPKS